MQQITQYQYCSFIWVPFQARLYDHAQMKQWIHDIRMCLGLEKYSYIVYLL